MKAAIKWIISCVVLHNLLSDLKDQWNKLYKEEEPELASPFSPSHDCIQGLCTTTLIFCLALFHSPFSLAPPPAPTFQISRTTKPTLTNSPATPTIHSPARFSWIWHIKPPPLSSPPPPPCCPCWPPAALADHLLPLLATSFCPCSPPALALHLLPCPARLPPARHLLPCPACLPPALSLPPAAAALCPSDPCTLLSASLAACQPHIHCCSLHHHRYVFKAHACGFQVHLRWPTHPNTLQSAAPEDPKLLPWNPCCSV
ncbi:hypothetical protein PCASD_05120 [Puccinia coronata f. sp. avenae]|uniref:Uncharacterized protein n=1 Tax=Puccinia coronata f. sp. avenae TaxID=200324 RepID=A0A2N5V3N5_9BASI|nr:hypothetical protein PCASD_05120 [Puccinia coronata f. sp. avenae]